MPASERYDGNTWTPGSLLSSLPVLDQEIVLKLGRARQYGGGEVIFRQGDRSDFVVVIIDGYVKISAVTDGGAETLLAIRMAGDVVGELAAMDGCPRSAMARTADTVLARVIMRPELDRCLAAHFTIARAFNQAVSAKLRMATRRRVDFRKDTRSRLAQVLVDLDHCSGRTRGDGRNTLPITQSELAGLIGASDAAVHKALRTLRDTHVVSTRYGRTIIENIATLRRIAEGDKPEIGVNVAELRISTTLRAELPVHAGQHMEGISE
jgi:CRP-like cAMP-binding protein